MKSDNQFQKTHILEISGIVQGVGFRPFIWQLANNMGLKGEVRNNSQGVEIILHCGDNDLARFEARMTNEHPPLAEIISIHSSPHEASSDYAGFSISPSQSGKMKTQITPDAATCPACIDEIFSLQERRYHYPFTNCTHCGPRLTIIHEAPYDRATTSMAPFILCPDCQKEYENPADRRFHAQPIACPACGPSLELSFLKDQSGQPEMTNLSDLIAGTADLIRKGKIAAIKGLGGFHLACLATNTEIVAELRHRKKRSNKAFALMVRNAEMAAQYGKFSSEELTLLQSQAAPIVLVDKGKISLPEQVAPGLHQFGIMLPNTPLHHLLMAHFDEPLIMTSGNVSNMPQLITNQEAATELAGIADFMLAHNRPITNRVDDSVARIVNGKPALIRRARGYAPAPLSLPKGFERAPDLIAFGGELKSTFCMIKDQCAILSQHLGDLEHVPTFNAYQQTIALYTDLFEHQPTARAIDKHPEYLSSKYGAEQSEKDNLPLIQIQHHHAHMASAMGENDHGREEGACLALIMDGVGFGEDGTIWGGELLLGDYSSFKRIGSFPAIPIPGGSAAIKQPWRNLVAHLNHTIGWETYCKENSTLPLTDYLRQKPVPTLIAMINKGLNAPKASSCGRLFDAVAAALNLSADEVTYEGEAAMQLEALVNNNDWQKLDPSSLYKASYDDHCNDQINLNFTPLWQGIFADLRAGMANRLIATKFHKSLTLILLDWVSAWLHNNRMMNDKGEQPTKIILSGGCFQNKTLIEALIPMLEDIGLPPLIHHKLPANDGSLSYGQALIAAARLMEQ